MLNSFYTADKKIVDITNPISAAVYKNNSLRETADLMAEMEMDFLPVVSEENTKKLIAILSRSDILRERKRNIQKTRIKQNL